MFVGSSRYLAALSGTGPTSTSTIWDRAHQAAMPTSHKTPQDKGDDDEGDGDDDDEGDVESRW